MYPILTSYQLLLGSQVEFDIWHKLKTFELIDNCPISWNDGSILAVGLAQKIINLHCKDIWAMDIIPSEFSQYFHVVIDMISLKHIGITDIAWTKVRDYRLYFDFQKKYRQLAELQNITPLEIECQLWNENAYRLCFS